MVLQTLLIFFDCLTSQSLEKRQWVSTIRDTGGHKVEGDFGIQVAVLRTCRKPYLEIRCDLAKGQQKRTLMRLNNVLKESRPSMRLSVLCLDRIIQLSMCLQTSLWYGPFIVVRCHTHAAWACLDLFVWDSTGQEEKKLKTTQRNILA